MIKRLFIIFLMSFGISQSDELESTLLGSFGSVTINDNVYNQFSLKPEFSIGKLGMGFDIYFYLHSPLKSIMSHLDEITGLN